MGDKIELVNTKNSHLIKINGHMHLGFPHNTVVSVISHIEDGKNLQFDEDNLPIGIEVFPETYHITIHLVECSVFCEYDNKARWEKILSLLEQILS
jgi:hypothetical protein